MFNSIFNLWENSYLANKTMSNQSTLREIQNQKIYYKTKHGIKNKNAFISSIQSGRLSFCQVRNNTVIQTKKHN